ncbi:Coatomer, gamma subunit, appendage, Ig-like subdomain [Dillenia turbinata]|uniref:Coatomer, gamma subunit, appendage, Ig-like subdomain n=1 Tax=Dillenia turbinata TaxID=194707 RepID=A0AAN8ZQD4_9MAGN
MVDALMELVRCNNVFFHFGMDSGRRFLPSSAPVELTEAETEYAVNVVRHIFDKHVVFQYDCTNTIPEQMLENVRKAEELSEVASKPLGSLPYDTPGQTFVAFEKPKGVPAVGKFSNMFSYCKELDPSTGEAEDDGVEDEYQPEDLEVVAADYMLKVKVLVRLSFGIDAQREVAMKLVRSDDEAVSDAIHEIVARG